MADPSPKYPFGYPVEIIKPGIPIPAWNDHGEITINEIRQTINSEKGNVVFKGVFDYKDTEAGIVLNNLNAKGYYIQHTRSGTFTANNNIRAYYNDVVILTNSVSMNADNPYTSAEMFIRNGMWVCQNTEPVVEMTDVGIVIEAFSRALTKDEPYITDIILSTSGSTSGSYRVWLY